MWLSGKTESGDAYGFAKLQKESSKASQKAGEKP
jgi:hypothetical protein